MHETSYFVINHNKVYELKQCTKEFKNLDTFFLLLKRLFSSFLLARSASDKNSESTMVTHTTFLNVITHININSPTQFIT